MRNKSDCPKCGSPNAWYEKDTYDLHLVCYCGLRKLVFTVLESGAEIQHNEPVESINLPRQGTKLWITLDCLGTIDTANSREVRDTLYFRGIDYTVSDVSSFLTMLRSKGLVDVLVSRRGVPDGSTWGLTPAAKKLMGVK